ncbi:Aste57867_17111 [Aphanomyces stellatus]|uniref:Aste57867_17111 protein n=1 Tax=Aphanomyces stellatus TaxID=120398 RepID=A0A485L7C0_9STRA|nr:hypothetical protein As57867_017052 [Aphanomyces stellatus]VFT93869.1 Aste57867_17111 [Aphanomyces stellatus]
MRRLVLLCVLVLLVQSDLYCKRCTGGLYSNKSPRDSLGAGHRDLVDPWTNGTQYRVSMENDGNFVLYDIAKAKKLWTVKSSVIPWYYNIIYLDIGFHARVVMQGDGNLVYVDKKPLWETGTSGQGHGPYCLTITRAGVLVVLDWDCNWLWSHDGSKRPTPANSTLLDQSLYEL